MKRADHLFVVTGGPGSGKTALIEALARDGMAHMPEGGRAIIQDQAAIGGKALPWADRNGFAELMLGWELRSHREGGALAGPVICDRGIPDVLGYLIVSGLPIPDHVRKACTMFRYNRTVFLAPYWARIFTRDSERRQDAAEAAATCDAMMQAYADCGYDLVTLPLAGIAERAAFVRSHIAGSAA